MELFKMKIEKISFVEVGEEKLSKMLSALPEDERLEAEAVIEDFENQGFIIPFAFSVTDGVIVVRGIYNDDIFFVFPIEISEKTDISAAINKVLRFAMLEGIEPHFECVPREALGLFFDEGYRHLGIEISPYDDTDKTYTVIVKNECMLVKTPPEYEGEEIELSLISADYITEYARLCRDVENNKYWGYDYRDDYPVECPDIVFAEDARDGLITNSSITYLITKDGVLLGEALISCFDFKGGADLSIRIFPEYQRQGYADKALTAVLELSSKLGLRYLYARVFKENLPSIRFFERRCDEASEADGVQVFIFKVD